MKGPQRRSIQSLITLFLLLGVFVVTAWLLEQHPRRWDITLAGEYTLSPQTLRLLNQVNDEVEILAFFQPDQDERERAAYLLDTYAYACDKIRYRFVDPDREPGLAQKYGIKGYGQLTVGYEGRRETVHFISEQDITNALAKVVHNESRTIYFLSGHGERNLENFENEGYSRLKNALEEQNYRVVSLNLMTAEKVPADASLVVIAGPERKIFPEEVDRLNTYLDGGGSLLVLLDPIQGAGFMDFLTSKNILLQSDLIIDNQGRVLGGDYLMPVITRYADHEITKNSTAAALLSEARSVRAKKGEVWIAKELAWTSDKSWAETDLKSALEDNRALFEEGKDLRGPVSVAVVSTKISKGLKPSGGLGADAQTLREAASRGKAFETSHVVVIGDSDFAKNALFDMVGNSDLALNAINFLAKSPELINIRPRSRETSLLTLTYSQAKWLFWYSFMLLPVIIIAGGLGAWTWKRRHR